MLLCVAEHPIQFFSRLLQNLMLERLHFSPTAGSLFDELMSECSYSWCAVSVFFPSSV